MSAPRPVERVAIVFNGSKDRGRLRAFQAELKRRLSLSDNALSVLTTTSGADAEPLAHRAAAEGHDTLIAAGGDGTVWGVLRGSLGSGARLGVLPLGTSNDIAVTLGIRRDADALAGLAAGLERAIDVARCRYADEHGREREDVLCTSGGLGFTARITQVERGRLVSTIKRVFGQPGWIPVCAALALSFPARRLQLRLDGRKHELTACLLELGKVVSIGGMPLLPRARLDGGYFDICAFEGSLARRMQLLGSLQVSKAHVEWPDFEYFCDEPRLNSLGMTRVREVEVVPDGPFPLHLHGEFVGSGPATFRLGGERISFLAPPTGETRTRR